ncbi:cytochrome P450 [Paenarthrobacter sp. NPDC089989]|uniref:cytochrome P450 n=1 Tax=unclassified Paenarthrobacter TaxID=2634190 RepID=UPI0037FE4B65
MTASPPAALQERPVPGRIPFFGHALSFAVRPQKFLETQRDLGAVTSIKLGNKNGQIVNDPTLVRELLVARTKDFIKSGPLYETSSRFVGNGLAVSEGPYHRQQRRLMQPSFRKSRIPGYHSAMREATVKMIETWQTDQTVDVWNDLSKLTVTVIGKSLYQGGFTDEMTEQIVRSVATASRGIGWRSLMPAWMHRVPTLESRDFSHAQQVLHSIADHVIADHQAHNADSQHFLTELLSARDEHGNALTDRQLRDEVVTLFSAGSATVATTLAWALHLVSERPEVGQRIHDEVVAILADGPVTADTVPRLTYTGRVVSEVLRLYPPAWLLPRVTTEDTTLGDHFISEGTLVFFSPYAIHHDPRLYPDPKRFDPNRWLPEEVAKRPRGSYVPFGAGVHQCIGNDFALFEIITALATITREWNLAKPPGAVVRPRGGRAVLEPKKLHLRVQKRVRSVPLHLSDHRDENIPRCPHNHDTPQP